MNAVAPRDWLQTLAAQYKSWMERAQTASSIFATLDSNYIHKHPHLKPTLEVLVEMFSLHVVSGDILSKCLDSAVACVDEERGANATGSSYEPVHTIIQQLSLRLPDSKLHRDLADRILDSTKQFYSQESEALIASTSSKEQTASAGTIEAFLTHAQRRIDEETARSKWLLTENENRTSLVSHTRTEFIATHLDWLLAGLPTLLEEEKPPLQALSLLYQHLSSVNAVEALTSIFLEHVIKVGTVIVSPPSTAASAKIKKPPQTDADKETLRQALAEEEKIIEKLLEFKEKIDLSVDKAFAGHISFVQKRTQGFEKVVNSRTGGAKVAELCAKYLDAKLKSGNRTMSDEELECCLNEALVLFRYTHAKDMFEEFYKRSFAKRLLLNRSASSDAEQSMLLKLKDECGPAFTQRLETMLKDITLSDDIMKSYATVQEKARPDMEANGETFDLTVQVLTQAHWPTYPTVEVVIPPAMATAIERFRTFYAARNSGRKLHWTHSLGTCVVTATFPKCGEKELLLSQFQTIVLLLFNGLASGDKLSYSVIAEQTKLEEMELKRTLQSLACGQIPTRVLRKEPQGRDVGDNDLFHFNEAFKNERHRIRINQIQMKESTEEQASTETRVLLDRELVIQAAAVRILKARKQLKHGELLQEVVDGIKSRFQVDVADIKKQFEILIEKEYMERVEGERGVYRYLA